MKRRHSIYSLILAMAMWSACVASAWELKLGTNLPPVDFHGFLSQGFLYSSDYNYLAEDTTEGSFQFTEIGLNASINPLPRTRIAAQAFAFEMGQEGNYEPVLDYALAEYTFNDWIGVRGGRIRRPHGIYTHIVDIDLARTWVLLPQGIYDARWRDFLSGLDGGEIFGSFSLGWAGSIAYEVYSGKARPTTSGGLAHLIENIMPPGSEVLSLGSPTVVGQQVWWNTPLDGFRLGFAFERVFGFQPSLNVNLPPPFGGRVSPPPADIDIWQASAVYNWQDWTFQAEYWKQMPSDAWYASAAYRFNKWFEAGAYYTEFYSDINDRDGSQLSQPPPGAPPGFPTLPSSDGYQKDTALSLRFDPTDWWVFKVEGHYIHGTALLRNNAANPVRNDDGWWMLAVKTTFSF